MTDKRRGFTLVEIMIVVGIIAMLAAIAIPNMLRARVTANEALAQSTLKAVATAMETYSNSNNGNYPTDPNLLVGANPPYLRTNFCSGQYSGYLFNCGLTAGTYSITASPVSSSMGTKSFTVTTGAVLKTN
ncbi:MAG: type II secretion system protein [Candidatus Omnitrophica bacterium]|nr:type II secretion system protein [Candidatus Omnitrophota bacterium]